MKHDPLDALLGRPGPDPGCDVGFTQLEHYCDAVRRGEDVECQFPGLVRHIQNCPACREDTEGLLAALEELEE
jgi:hypothetical protein